LGTVSSVQRLVRTSAGVLVNDIKDVLSKKELMNLWHCKYWNCMALHSYGYL